MSRIFRQRVTETSRIVWDLVDDAGTILYTAPWQGDVIAWNDANPESIDTNPAVPIAPPTENTGSCTGTPPTTTDTPTQ